MKEKFFNLFKDNKSFILFLLIMFAFRSAIADWNTVPTGSMKPTILEGDRIFVNKIAYDLRVPFTRISVLELDRPSHGDIIVFESEFSNKRLVKRVIGVPGDSVALVQNSLYLNGKPLEYTFLSTKGSQVDLVENLFGKTYSIRLSNTNSYRANFSAVAIPANYYLVLGDNRDNSADSRVIGLVPRHEIIGKAESVVMSLNYENYFLPRANRYFQPL